MTKLAPIVAKKSPKSIALEKLRRVRGLIGKSPIEEILAPRSHLFKTAKQAR